MSTPVDEHRSYAPNEVSFGIVTVSGSRDVESDDSGRRIEELAAERGFASAERLVVPDEGGAIRNAVKALLSRDDVDAVVVNGGTGFSPRDVTPESVTPLFDDPIPGFGELFRSLSWKEIGAAAMLSRATAGVVGAKPVFLLPGSPKAVELAMRKLILPEVAHLLGQLRRGGGTALQRSRTPS